MRDQVKDREFLDLLQEITEFMIAHAPAFKRWGDVNQGALHYAKRPALWESQKCFVIAQANDGAGGDPREDRKARATPMSERREAWLRVERQVDDLVDAGRTAEEIAELVQTPDGDDWSAGGLSQMVRRRQAFVSRRRPEAGRFSPEELQVQGGFVGLGEVVSKAATEH